MRTRTGKHATGRCPNTSPSRSPLPFTCVGSSPPCAAEGRPFTICVWRGGIKGRYFKARKHQRKSGYAHVELWVGRPIYRQKCFLDSFSTMPFVFALVCSGGVGTQQQRRSSGQVHGRRDKRTAADIECSELDSGRDPNGEWASDASDPPSPFRDKLRRSGRKERAIGMGEGLLYGITPEKGRGEGKAADPPVTTCYLTRRFVSFLTAYASHSYQAL